MTAIIIRPEKPEDYREIEILTRDAFWDIYKPGCDEHLVVHKLRNSSAFVADLDLVACSGDLLVGNIMYSRARVQGNEGLEFELLCLGPVTVHPNYQRQGIGGRLILESLSRARSWDFAACF